MGWSKIGRARTVLISVYVLATIQFVWCYLRIPIPYIHLPEYEQGIEKMPFQGRMLMMWLLRWAHHSSVVSKLRAPFQHSQFWFPDPVISEDVLQTVLNLGSILLAGWITTKIYQASSKRQLLTPFIYPLFLVVCAASYMMHTVQNFRFVYDLPSLAFFATAMYLMYFRYHWAWFAALFCVATLNRETTLLLLPLFLINNAVEKGVFRWRRLFRLESLLVVVPLAVLWEIWQTIVKHRYAANTSEFYARLDWNAKSLALPLAWPQLLSAGGYLLLFVVVMRRRIFDTRLRAWLWIIPIWVAFMFVYGILVETRVYGELIPLIVCSTGLIVEDLLITRMRAHSRRSGLKLVEDAGKEREAA